MTPSELAHMCVDAINAQAGTGIPRHKAEILLTTPKGWKPKDGFPRGHVVAVRENGDRVRYVGAARVLSWMLAAGMIEVDAKRREPAP